MLVLSRHKGEAIKIGGNITVVVTKIVGNRVSLAIDAPLYVRIERPDAKDKTNKGPMAVAIAGMLGHTCSDPDCENCRNTRAQVERDTKERNAAAKLASERSIMLRAKLIGLRDGLAADKAFDEAGKG